MGKVLRAVVKIGAIVAGIALAIPSGGTSLLAATLGVSSLAAGAIAAGLSIGASLLSRQQRAPQNSPENVDRLRASINPLAPRKTWIGITAAPTDIMDEEFTDGQTQFHRFIVCSSHKAQSFEEIWFDDKLAWSDSGGIQPEFLGYLGVETYVEGSAANAKNISPRMGSTRRYTGLSWVYLRFKLTGNSKKTESPFAQSVPTRITIRGRGALLPDPRNPAHDMDDQSTWTWDENACRNPALALLFYLLGWRINGKLAVGKGIPSDRIDLDSFITAANICDELVTKPGGGTEPRYRCDGVWSEGDSPTTVIDMLKACMNADLDDVGGKLRLTIFRNDLATPIADFGDNDIIDAFSWQPLPPLDATFNVVRGVYTDGSDQSLYQQVDYPEQRLESPDGIDRIDTFNLPMVQSPTQAQRLAELRLQRQRFAGLFEAEFQASAWKVTKNSVIRLTFGQTGFVQKFFRVAEMEIRQDGRVPMKLREEDPAIYGDPPFTDPISPVFPSPFDPANSPYAQALATIEEGATVGATMPLPGEYDIGTGAVGNIKRPNGTLYLPGELLNSALTLTPAGQLQFRSLPGNAPVTLGTLSLPDLGAASEVAIRKAEDDIDQVSRALATALGEASRTRETLTDAGFYSDPATGQVRIHAIEQTRERVSAAEIRLNAAEANINLRATVSYVDQAILNAVLDPSQIAELDTVFLRLTAAEVDIDGLQATVTTLATATELSLLAGRVTTAESAIDALEGTITTKVDTTTFDALESRVTSAESTLTALGDTAAITNVVRAVRLVEREQYDNAEQDLRALLQGDRNRRDQVAAIAEARQEITAQIVNDREAFATTLTALAARVGSNEAAVVAANIARADADSALAASISTLTTTVAGNTASINTFAESINGLQARAGVRLDVNGRVTGWVLNNSGNQGSMDVVVDSFRIFAPGMAVAQAPFEFSGGNLRLSGNVRVGGNLVVDGTLTANAFEANGLTRAYETKNAGSIELDVIEDIVTISIEMARPGTIILIANAQFTFTTGSWEVELAVDSTVLQTGTSNHDRFAGFAGTFVAGAAGTYVARLRAAGTNVFINAGGASLVALRTYT